MTTKQEIIDYCLSFNNVYEDYPFRERRKAVIKHMSNNKMFISVFNKNGNTWINLKGRPESNEFFRNVYKSVIPAFHMNKEHWNSIILDGTVPDEDIMQFIDESYELTT